jgi:leader peptidase (prepilin peptidase)/N-methyltransferase
LTILAKGFKIETNMEVALIVIFVLLGMVVASFLNVCCDRLPVGKSIVYPPSHCPACRRRLRAKDLIPVFSYLWLRGRCRYCQAPIPRRLLWVEIGTGVLFGLVYWRFGLSLELPIILVYSCIFIVLLVIDLEHRLVLNKVVYPAMALALLISILFSFFLPQLEIVPGIAPAAIGGGIGLGLFLLIVLASRGGMGCGLLLSLKIKRRREAIPFAPFLSLAAIVTLLWGSNILNWYLGLFR